MSVAPNLREAMAPGPDCVHHFVLEAPTRAGSKGQCRKCGEERRFPVSGSDSWARVNARARVRGTNAAR